MNAGIGWIDFLKKDRDILKSVLDALAAPGVVDELGIGSIRNSISDLLFPGISTIQTRAKYFVLVVQIISEYEILLRSKKEIGSLAEYLRKRENELIHKLAEKYGGKKGTGIIGINAARRNEEIKRKPSSIYWSGIIKHRLIKSDLSFSEYLRQFENLKHIGGTGRKKRSDEMLDDYDVDYFDRFGLNLPKNLRKIDDDLSIELTQSEANYLQERLLEDGVGLLSEILKDVELAKEFVSFPSYRKMVESFKTKNISKQNIKILSIGEQFDFIIHGAHVRYNYLLNKELAGDKWEKWLQELDRRKIMVEQFDFKFLKSICQRTKGWTMFFVQSWITELNRQPLNLKEMDSLITQQERKNKKNLARLSMPNPEPSQEWVGLGNNQENSSMSFRFANAKRIISDILDGLN